VQISLLLHYFYNLPYAKCGITAKLMEH